MAKLSAKKPSHSVVMSSGKKEALSEISTEPTKKLNVNIPESLHYSFKKKCLDEKINMSELIKKWIQDYTL